MATLPIDLIFSFSCILPQLPVKSLLRFKCVSRSFLAEISSPIFVKIHHLNSLSSNGNRHLIWLVENESLYMYDLDSPHSLSSVFRYPGSDTLPGAVSIVASCECYVLIGSGYTYPGQYLVMLNPTTRTYVKLPRLLVTPDTHHDPIYGICHCVDEFNDDYKVVRFREFDHQMEVMVYSLRTQVWKLIEDKPTVETIVSRYRGAAVLVQDHLLHLIFVKAFASEHRMIRIGCFDIKAERWANDVLLSDILLDNLPLDIGMLDMPLDIDMLDGKLCFLGPDTRESTIDLWVMKDYGVKESWVKLMSLPMSNDVEGPGLWKDVYHPIVYRKDTPNELLCRRYQSGDLFWYNFRDKEAVEYKFDGGSYPRYDLPCVCKGSLLNFPGGQPIEVSSEEEEEIEWEEGEGEGEGEQIDFF